MNFKIMTKAQLAPRHLVAFLGVSRVAASNWVNGHSSPHTLLQSKVEYFLDAVKDAVEREGLPVSKELKGFEREAKIRNEIKESLRRIKAGKTAS